MLVALLPALVGYHLGARRPSARLARCAAARCAEASTTIQYGGIPHVAVIVGDAKEALTYYTEVLGTATLTLTSCLPAPNPSPDQVHCAAANPYPNQLRS